MAYDEALAGRVRQLLDTYALPGLSEKKMFGGVGYLVGGNMACGVHQDWLNVRVWPERYDMALAEPDVRVFDMTGRPMRGWVTVAPEGRRSDQALDAWIRQGVDFALTLPEK